MGDRRQQRLALSRPGIEPRDQLPAREARLPQGKGVEIPAVEGFGTDQAPMGRHGVALLEIGGKRRVAGASLGHIGHLAIAFRQIGVEVVALPLRRRTAGR